MQKIASYHDKNRQKSLWPRNNPYLAQIITLKMAKLCRNNNFTACIYIYIYAVKLLSGPSLAPFGSYYLVQSLFFSKTPIAKKHYKNRGFSTLFWKNCAQKNWKLLSGPSWRFLRRTQLGPDNNFQLGPDNNFQKCHFWVKFCSEKCAENTYFYSVLLKIKKNWQKLPKKHNFSHFAKHRSIKKPLCCTPIFF